MPGKSISTRLNLALVAIIAVIMTAFAILATLFTIDRISRELDTKLANYLRISSVSLEAPLWNFDHSVVEGYLDALMLDETMIYANVSSPDGTVTTRARPVVEGLSFAQITASEDHKAREGAVLRDGEEIGRIELALSRAAVRQELLTNIAAIVALALLVLATITVASILISRRFVARPLANLQHSAAAIGSGDLQTDIDTTGQDEIGVLAREFDGMRNSIRRLIDELKTTNVELEAANQTLEERVEERTSEVVTTQQKLVDAIESTSEGFAFFDHEDRLILHNAQYEKLLYGGSDVSITPGMCFEDILRMGVDNGLISVEGDGREAFIAERVEKHRNPGLPILQRRGSRGWIQISERKTSDGGTVAVFSDVSELKNREADLTEKTTTLEHLSSQLAKYLSPQIYDSIFKGGQEVKVTSSRKKLTVFFSDIEGFTETAEEMESEELTSLLNNYLTEMSRIALEYGATIDKYVGDAILIFFGDPQTRGVKQDALACVNMAIAMSRRMTELQADWRRAGLLRPLRCRIGIHTDFCTVGNFGSESRLDYTIIGRAVNAAARIEAAGEPGKILMSYATYAQVSEEIPCKSRGQIEVKGISKPVEVYEVEMDDDGAMAERVVSASAETKLELDIEALSDTERQKFKTLLHDLLSRIPSDDRNDKNKAK